MVTQTGRAIIRGGLPGFGSMLFLCAVLATDARAQQPIDSTLMATLQRFKADTIYHVRVNTKESAFHVYLGHVPLIKCRFTLVGEGNAEAFRDDWMDEQTTGWRSITKRKVWSGRPAVSDTVVGVVAKVSKVDPELISRVMPRRFVVDLTDDFIIRVMTVEGAGEERSFEEKMGQFTEDWIPFMRQPHLDVVVTEKDAQTLYYALEPGTPVVLVDK